MIRPKLCCISLAAIAVALCHRANAANYTVTNIGTLPGASSSQGFAINATGMVAGASPADSGDGFVYTPGSATLTDIPGFSTSLKGTAAFGINDSGVVTGEAITDNTLDNGAINGVEDAFVFSGGRTTDIGSLGGLLTTGQAINNSGTVVGYGYISGAGEHAFSYNVSTGTPGALKDLSSGTGAAGSSQAFAINASGLIAGGSTFPGFSGLSAATYNATTNKWTRLPAVSGSQSSEAYGINASGEVVGRSFLSANTAFAYTPATGTSISLGDLGGGTSIAYAVNTMGLIVGSSAIVTGPDETTDHAFITTAGGTMVDLNNVIPSNSGFVLNTATGINDAGDITGEGAFNGQEVAYELIPTSTPEPSSITLISFSGILLSRRRRV